jgi:hypothetical protein
MSNKESSPDPYFSPFAALSQTSNLGNEGSWIILEVAPADYLLSQIAHLVEQNNAHLLHVFTYIEESTGLQIVLLKISRSDPRPVARSLECFNYTVRHTPEIPLPLDEPLRQRVNELMHYLEL